MLTQGTLVPFSGELHFETKTLMMGMLIATGDSLLLPQKGSKLGIGVYEYVYHAHPCTYSTACTYTCMEVLLLLHRSVLSVSNHEFI
jgi:hypothetical protein